LLVEKGVLTDAEIQTKFEEVKARHGVKVAGAKKRKVKPAAASGVTPKPGARSRKGTSP
jgi:hypothetical protein